MLKLTIRELVERLKCSIIGIFLLNGVIGKMNLSVEVVYIVRVGRSSNVTLFIPIASADAIEVCYEQVMADIELSLVI